MYDVVFYAKSCHRGEPMKKLIIILSVVLALFALCACSNNEPQAYIPPATDNPPVSADTGAAPDASPEVSAPTEPPAVDTLPPAPPIDADPIVAPKPEPQVTICIDAGHGGKDSGAVWGDRMEKDDALNLALKVAEQVEALGQRALLTRDDDSYPYFSERADIANNADADVFVSLHRNSAEGARGVEIWISYKASSDTVEFAEDLLSLLEDVGISKNRGVKKGTVADPKDDYYVNKLTNMTSCIVELGFIQSDEDNRLYDENMDAYAKAIAGSAVKEALRALDEAK